MAVLNIWWNINEPLSYNALFYWIIGVRGNGKSYGTKKKAIDNFLKYGDQFIYIRRYLSEFESVSTYFDDISERYKPHTFEVKGGMFYIDDEVAGFYFSLSTSQKYKSTPYPRVEMIIFDEFLIVNEGASRYLKNEVIIFLELVETVFRFRDPCVFMLGNAISETNPYFIYLNLRIPKNKKKIKVFNDNLVQLAQNEKYIEKKSQTRMYKMLDGTAYKKYAVENVFLKDKKDFIKSAPATSKYIFTIQYGDQQFGVYNAYNDGIWFVSEKFDPSCKLIYVTKLSDHRPNTMLLKGTGRSVYIDNLLKNFKNGAVFFDKIGTYNVVLEAVKGAL
jgi:hypothetical protein